MEKDLSTVSVESLIRDADLPSFPHVLIEIYRVLYSDRSDAESVSRLIRTDTALAARTLQIANSAYYSGSNEITDIKHAVVRIGPLMLWSLLVSTTVRYHFAGVDTRVFDMHLFWRHSLYTACLSKAFSIAVSFGNEELCYVSGLLHDIGKLLFLIQVPLDYQEVLENAQYGTSLVDDEICLFGFSHAHLGACLLEAWGLPPVIVGSVRYHHDCLSESNNPAWVVATANTLYHDQIDNSGVEIISLPAQCDALSVIEQASAEYEQMAGLFSL